MQVCLVRRLVAQGGGACRVRERIDGQVRDDPREGQRPGFAGPMSIYPPARRVRSGGSAV